MDRLSELLRELSDIFESCGGDGRIGVTFDVPVKISVNGREVGSVVQLRWTEEGLELPDPEGQALRIMEEINSG